MIFLSGESFLTRLKNFFKADVSEVVGAYFDGEKIFVVRLTEEFEVVEVEAEGFEVEQLAEKISLTCREKGWKTSAVGFCLQDDDAVTFQTGVDNLPPKEIPSFIKSWAVAQAEAEADADAMFSSTSVGEELWMETLSRKRAEEFVAVWEKFGMKLRALSIMPPDLLRKNQPVDKAKFIAEIIREDKSPNFLATRGSSLNLKKISYAVAAIFLIVLLGLSTKIFLEYRTASINLDAAKNSVAEFQDDLALKKNLDENISELHRLNEICAAQDVSTTKFNLLLNLGKISGEDVHLTEIRLEENSLELEGVADKPDAVKSYLGRVKNSVAQNARLENSSEREDGEIAFRIRAAL